MTSGSVRRHRSFKAALELRPFAPDRMVTWLSKAATQRPASRARIRSPRKLAKTRCSRRLMWPSPRHCQRRSTR